MGGKEWEAGVGCRETEVMSRQQCRLAGYSVLRWRGWRGWRNRAKRKKWWCPSGLLYLVAALQRGVAGHNDEAGRRGSHRCAGGAIAPNCPGCQWGCHFSCGGSAVLAFTHIHRTTTSQFSLVTINYTYDPLYRLTAANYGTGQVYTYTYDAVGNRLGDGGPAGAKVYTYDDANRLGTINGTTTQTWDNNGNLLNDGAGVTYTYDAENRLLALNASLYTYAYDGLGDRVQQISSGSTITYTLDQAADLTQVLAEANNSGVTSYLYGSVRLAQQTITGTDYYLPDALGSVRQLANASGNITLRKSYDPYGQAISSSGSGSTNFDFTGEYKDPSALLFLRARYYASPRGRFLEKDSRSGNLQDPQSLNAWAYTEGNPVNWTDPSGSDHVVPCFYGCNGTGIKVTSWQADLWSIPCVFIGCKVVRVDNNYWNDPWGGQWEVRDSAPTIPNPMGVEVAPLESLLEQCPIELIDYIERQVSRAEEAQSIVGTTVEPLRPTWSTTAQGTPLIQSGTSLHPMTDQGTAQAMQLAEDMGFTFNEAGFQDNGVPGSYFAGHAEPQGAALAPNQALGVSRPMCLQCQKFFSELATYRDIIQVVADPDLVRVFFPGGLVGIKYR